MIRWSNWTGDQSCRPADLVRPSDVDGVIEQVARAAAEGWTVRVVGAGHSFTAAVATGGLLMSLDRMDRVLDVDRESGLVRVEAGIRLRHLNEVLDRHGLALENLGDIDVQSIAGATATGTHGTGAKLRNLSASIHALQMVAADGSVLEIDGSSDRDLWRAARVSIGALGVVTAVTLQTVPAFNLKAVDGPRLLDDVLADLDSVVDTNDHFEFYTFPHSPIAQTRTNNRTTEQARPRSALKTWIDDSLLINHVFGATRRFGRRWPAAIPAINRISARAWGASQRVDRSYRVFASERRVRFTEMEYAIPRSRTVEAVRAVREIADRSEHKVSFPIEIRFVAPDDALLSPASGRETAYIAIHAFEKMPWEPYFRAVEEVMDGLDGRPHWGKRHFQTAATLRARYPEFERFVALRDRLDPGRRFTNDYVRQVLDTI